MAFVLLLGGCQHNEADSATPSQKVPSSARESDRMAGSGETSRAAGGSAPRPSKGWEVSAAPASKRKLKDAKPPEPPALTNSEQARYDAVVRKLVAAINDRDKTAYRALHTDAAWANAIDWWRDMFTAQVLKFGPIRRAYPPQRGMVRFGKMGMGGDARNGASFVVIFEKKVGGLFSFELNDEDKIVHTSVFIKEELGEYDGWGAKVIYERED